MLGLVGYRDELFGAGIGQWAKAGSLAAGQNEAFQGGHRDTESLGGLIKGID